MKFRKKPVEIEASQFTKGGAQHLVDWINHHAGKDTSFHTGEEIYIKTRSGLVKAFVGDWIAKGFAEGLGVHFWVVESQSFESFYEVVQ